MVVHGKKSELVNRRINRVEVSRKLGRYAQNSNEQELKRDAACISRCAGPQCNSIHRCCIS